MGTKGVWGDLLLHTHHHYNQPSWCRFGIGRGLAAFCSPFSSPSWRHFRLLLIIGTGSRFLVVFLTIWHTCSITGADSRCPSADSKNVIKNTYSPGNSGDQLLDYLGSMLHLCTLCIWAQHLLLCNFWTLSSSFRILNRGHECANKGNVLDRTNKQSIPLINTSCIRCPPSCYLRL